MDGLAATRALREWELSLPEKPYHKIVAFSATVTEEEWLSAGMDCALEKPIRASNLRAALDTYFKEVWDEPAVGMKGEGGNSNSSSNSKSNDESNSNPKQGADASISSIKGRSPCPSVSGSGNHRPGLATVSAINANSW